MNRDAFREVILAVSLMLAAVGTVACGPSGKKVATDVGACALDQLPSAVSEVVPEVLAALTGTAADWAGEIVKLEQRGMAFCICAIKAAVADLRSKRGVELAGPAAIGIDRADVYLAGHGVK